MPTFHLHLNDSRRTFPSELGIEFADLEQAYLEVCAAIPDMARDLLIKRQDPLVLATVTWTPRPFERMVECSHLAHFDDDQRLLGFVEWAEPHTRATRGGKTEVRIAKMAPT